MLGRASLKLRIEPDIDAVGAVIELEVAEKGCVRPDVVYVEQLAPPVMANDDIGREPKLLQVCRRMGNDVSTPERRIEFARRDMNLCRRTRRFGYGTTRTPSIRFAFGSLMNTTSCFFVLTRCRTICRYWPGKF